MIDLLLDLQEITSLQSLAIELPANAKIFFDQIRVLVNFEMLTPDYFIKMYDPDLSIEKLVLRMYPT